MVAIKADGISFRLIPLLVVPESWGGEWQVCPQEITSVMKDFREIEEWMQKEQKVRSKGRMVMSKYLGGFFMGYLLRMGLHG